MKIFTKSIHSYVIIAYFLIHSCSVFVHYWPIYLVYELLFVLVLITGVKNILKVKTIGVLVSQSLFIHVLLTILYLYGVFLIQGVRFSDPIAGVVFYPLIHFGICCIVYRSVYAWVKRS